MGNLKTINKLNMADSYKVCDWLIQRGIRVGDTQSSLAREAAAALGMPKVSSSHITERLRQLEMKIPEKPETYDQAKMAVAINVLARSIRDLYHQLDVPIPAELLNLL